MCRTALNMIFSLIFQILPMFKILNYNLWLYLKKNKTVIMTKNCVKQWIIILAKLSIHLFFHCLLQSWEFKTFPHGFNGIILSNYYIFSTLIFWRWDHIITRLLFLDFIWLQVKLVIAFLMALPYGLKWDAKQNF